jgi:addiction module HigA family antidote
VESLKMTRPETDQLPPLHPGEVLREEFLEPLGLSAYRLAKEIGVPPQRMAAIAREARGISADTALRLGRYFGMSAEFWMNLQKDYDLELARVEWGEEIEAEVHPRAAP